MRKVEHRLRLDLLRGGNQGYIRVKRGENGARRLAIALYMHSVPYMADAGTTAVFRAIKPDNTKLFNSATITDNVVTVGLTTQTVAALGTVRCELSIYGTNNELLYSPQFDIIVEDYLYSDTAVESTSEYTELTEAISNVNNIVSTEAARVAAENQRVANENARVSAEAERASAETARAEAETARATAETERASAETTRASAESSRAFSENIRKQAEKQRVSSETQRDTAETARSTAESGRRSAETARVQEFNAIKADAQDAATAEAARALAEELRMALYNQWDNATASVKGGKNIDVNVVEADGHKNFDFTIPSDSLYCETRTTITNGDLETIAREHARTIIVFDLPLSDVNNKNPTDYGLPADIAWNFTLINGPSQNVGTKDYFISYPNATVAAVAFVFVCPQTLIDGNNIYMRRLSYWDEKDKDEVSHWKFEGEDWEPVGGTADAVTYTPQTLTTEQQAQARANIGAGQPVFAVNVTLGVGEDGRYKYTADKTAAEIEAAYQAGRTIVCKTQVHFLSDYIPVELPLVSRNQERVFIFAVEQLIGIAIFTITVNINDSRVEVSTRGVEIYEQPADGIPKSDLADDVQTSLAKADTAISLGLTAATPGQIIKVKTVQDGKPTEWEAVNPDYTLTVTVNTQDGVTVTGQTVTVRAGDADGPVYGTAEYNGQPVSFRVPDGFAYYAEVTDNLAAHFRPTTVKGVINGANAAVTLLYNDFSTIQTAPDIQAALNADMDLTEFVGQQITCQRGNDTLSWDVVDYDSVAKVVTLCTHDVLPDNMQFELKQALMYCEDGLVAGSYTFKWNNTQCYFTLTQAIPVGGQLRATDSAFQTYESVTAIAQMESGTVSTDVIDGATNLGQTGTGDLNYHDRVNYGSNNFGESGILQWLNSDSPANTPMPRLTKFSRPYVPTKAGFKADLDAEFLACIQDTTWECSANNVYECPVSLGGIAQKGNPYTVTAKFALASEIEVFGEYGGVQDGGTVWDLYVGAEATDRIKYYNNTARRWWLRSPYWHITHLARSVSTSGAGDSNYANGSNGVAVACKIAKSA